MENLKLSDSVIARIAQCVQEAMIFGTDVVDILRDIELTTDVVTGELVMTTAYAQKVIDSHKEMLDRAEDLQILSNLSEG